MCDREQARSEHDAALKRLLALSLSVCERIEAKVAAAETDEELQARTLAFTRAARSVRQTIALRERLFREEERAERAAAEGERKAQGQAVQARRAKVRYVLEREVEDAREGDDAAEALEILDILLTEDMLEPDFATRPLEPYLAQLRFDLGLPAPAPEGEPAPPVEANTS